MLLGSYSCSPGWPVTYFLDQAGFEFIATVQKEYKCRHESPSLNKQYFLMLPVSNKWNSFTRLISNRNHGQVNANQYYIFPTLMPQLVMLHSSSHGDCYFFLIFSTYESVVDTLLCSDWKLILKLRRSMHITKKPQERRRASWEIQS